jgi:hypothetical protein
MYFCSWDAYPQDLPQVFNILYLVDSWWVYVETDPRPPDRLVLTWPDDQTTIKPAYMPITCTNFVVYSSDNQHFIIHVLLLGSFRVRTRSLRFCRKTVPAEKRTISGKTYRIIIIRVFADVPNCLTVCNSIHRRFFDIKLGSRIHRRMWIRYTKVPIDMQPKSTQCRNTNTIWH